MESVRVAKKKIVFLHIPKTAGTAVHENLSKHFNAEEICPERFRGLGRYSVEQLDRYSYFSGHFNISLINRIPGDKFIFTIFRNPKDRILSLYYFWRRHKEEFARHHKLLGPLAARSMDLAEFLGANRDPPRDAIKNEMARTFAGAINANVDGRYFERSSDGRKEVSKYEIIRRSVNALSRIDYVGFVETLECDMKNIYKLNGLEGSTSMPQRNFRTEVSDHLEIVAEQAINDEAMRRLEDLTELDQIIYNIAKLRKDFLVSKEH